MQINQFILNKNQIQSTEANEFALSQSDLQGYKQTIEKLSQQKKKTYLQAIQSNNQELINKIKDMDRKLNRQVDSLSKKIVPTRKRSAIPRLEEMETPQLANKFQELNRLKHQLQNKKIALNSLQSLLTTKQQHLITLNSLDQEILEVKHKISHLQKIKQKADKQDNQQNKQIVRVCELNLYREEISQLKKKVKQKREEVNNKKEAFLSLYKKNRSNKSFIAQMSPKERKVEDIDPQLAELKKQYEQMGRKIDLLKAKKNNLIKNMPDPTQKSKILQRLKIKYESFSKLSK